MKLATRIAVGNLFPEEKMGSEPITLYEYKSFKKIGICR
jgi:hypothetical protein